MAKKQVDFFVFHKLFSSVIPKKNLFFIGKCDKI